MARSVICFTLFFILAPLFGRYHFVSKVLNT
jgi:hypothetical protein